jgi:hypothetical protein
MLTKTFLKLLVSTPALASGASVQADEHGSTQPANHIKQKRRRSFWPAAEITIQHEGTSDNRRGDRQPLHIKSTHTDAQKAVI